MAVVTVTTEMIAMVPGAGTRIEGVTAEMTGVMDTDVRTGISGARVDIARLETGEWAIYADTAQRQVRGQ